MELRIYLSRLKLYLEHMYDLHMEIYVHIFSFSYVQHNRFRTCHKIYTLQDMFRGH